MKSFWSLLPIALIFACTSKSDISEQELQKELDSMNRQTPVVDDNAVRALLEQIPNPLEISMLIKQSEAKFNGGILNNPGNITHYNTHYKKALNLGVYGVDLGYANIYEKDSESVRYLGSIKSLANDLNIGQFFDSGTINRLVTNSDNLDSLLLITTQNFNDINRHLQDQNRSNLSLLFLVGGWIEAMNIMCEISNGSPANRGLIEGIGEQKIVLEQMVLLLSLYEKDPAMSALVDDFAALKEAYNNVVITYTYGEPKMHVVNGVVVIEDNSTTTVSIKDEDTARIKNVIDSIRSKIIS
jgi:hypothetical protein